ncbi:MAG: hypothetical protein GY793_08690 [Proteobacteria bacterium]|nr:hypothetical protein [Pseudomonadota bacterium]
MRVFLIIIANLSIPFLIFYLRNFFYKLYYTKVSKQPKKEIPNLDLSMVVKLIVVGLILLTLVLGSLRLKLDPEPRESRYKVKEYNFR